MAGRRETAEMRNREGDTEEKRGGVGLGWKRLGCERVAGDTGRWRGGRRREGRWLPLKRELGFSG